MFIRCAFFQGKVKPGMEDAFNRYIRENLVPLWTRFPERRKYACCARSRAT